MKKAIAWLLVVAMTAAISIGGTLAYLTDTDEDVNVMTVGQVKIDQLEYERVDVETNGDDAKVQEFHDNKPLYPAVTKDGFDWGTTDGVVDWEQIGKDGYTSGIWNPEKINNEVDKMVFVKNKGDFDAYVRTVFAFEAGNYTNLEEFRSKVHLNLNDTDWTWEWTEPPVTIGEGTYFVATATYNKVLKPGALTEISLSQIALDPSATNEDVTGFGDTYQVLVQSQAVQTAGFTDADTALDEAFGEIIVNKGTVEAPDLELDSDEIPWEDDNPIRGIDLKTALHYYEGDSSKQITTQVTNIVYGLNSKYSSITADCDGTLIDVEQDVPVRAYYVPNGSNYDVYVLADDVVYSPKNSASLYQGMSALKTVDTTNYDVSRVETMQKMFRDCGKLTTLDTTGWDTSKVANMSQMFYKCGALQEIPGIESWKTGAVTTMKTMFRQCGVKNLDLDAWDVSDVTNMAQLCYNCPNLLSADLTGWDAGACTDMSYLFTNCFNVQDIKSAGMDTSSVTNMYAMFGDCHKLATLNVTGWDTSNVTNATCMFTRCRALVSMIGSGGLNFGKVTDMASMCEGWDSMPYIDVTNWNCGSATNMAQMFAWGLKLEKVHGLENWNTSNVKSMEGMFLECHKLLEVNMTGWDVSKVESFRSMFDSEHQNMGDMALEKVIGLETWNPVSATHIGSMFYGCGQLTELNLSGWNLLSLKNSNHMFADCYKLESVDLTGWNTPVLFSMDCMFNHCKALKSIDMSSFTTDNVKEFSQLFEHCYSLTEVKGLENWNTANGASFSEMFSSCKSLKVLNLSSFNTRGADEKYKYHYTHVTDYGEGFEIMFDNMFSLEKLILSADISFDGDGKVTTESYKMKLPAPAAKEGFTAKWRNVETGKLYLASEIPEGVAATYEAYYEPIITP